MILYRIFQPILQSAFGAAVFILKHAPGLQQKTLKLQQTWDIRTISGRPAFYSIPKQLFSERRPVWIHAASGEFEYAKPVIRELRAQQPNTPIVVTYFSPTYAEFVKKFPGVTASCPLPLDSREELEQFLDHLNPSHLLIARTDAWPNTVLATNLRQIPILLFSTTFHEQSKRMGGLGKQLTRETLKRIDLIQCVSEEDVTVLASLGLKNTEVAGDTRYDQVLSRLGSAKPPTVQAMMEAFKASIQKRSFVAGSIWREDLLPVVRASAATRSESPHTLILVPHEISETFLQEIEAACVAAGFRKEKMTRLTRLSHGSHPLDVVIVDSVGLLAELYQLSEIAFVGGSFRKTVHSVMEPLAAGCLTIVGPLHSNNREAIEFQVLHAKSDGTGDSPAFVTCVHTEDEFRSVLNRLWKATATRDFKTPIRTEVALRGGATAKVLNWLSKF